MKNLAIFASGNGSNFQAIVEYFTTQPYFPIKLLVCDNPTAPVITRARRLNIPVAVFSYKDYSTKHLCEQAMVSTLQAYDVEFLALAGFMRLLGPTILKAFPSSIVNIHPSLLPAFP